MEAISSRKAVVATEWKQGGVWRGRKIGSSKRWMTAEGRAECGSGINYNTAAQRSARTILQRREHVITVQYIQTVQYCDGGVFPGQPN